MKKIFLATTALIALASGSAIAADMPVKTHYTPPAPVYTWTGCYVGAGFGWGMYTQDSQVVSATTGAGVFGPLTFGGRGALGTVQVGCDYQFAGNWVIGAFADYDWRNFKGQHTGADGNIGLIHGEQTNNRAWAAGGRIGYQVMPGFLTFMSAGVTQARFGDVAYLLSNNTPYTTALPSQTYRGYFIGAGSEYALGFLPGLFWKNEYRFSDYRAQSPAPYITATGVSNGFLEATHPYTHTIRTELVWRFGGWGKSVVAAY